MPSKNNHSGNNLPTNKKVESIEEEKEYSSGEFMNTNQGVRISDDQNSLKAGDRGATLLEDFIFREKMTHFDHERIPERIVHARGSAAHGVFKLYKPIPDLTTAAFLNNTEIETPVFVRFSTVVGSRGSTDLPRDVRGFAVKFYTEEGNFDIVGNNMPVFFIQDAMKFPDLVHAVKPEPNNEMPQASAAHDTFWDFISLMPESAHMIMWVMSDRAIPRSYRMMEGFGVHSFRLLNEKGESHFVKFHWKPLLGVHSVAWDEAQQISGKDPDFHRRDLWESIERGAHPEWELGIQVVPEADEHKYDFDLLDPTKLIPEELVPVLRIGKMTLNRNPDNFFAETEQVAFHVGNIVPGIDFTNDPLMQGRLFSYSDTQLIRLGGPNFHEIPINRPIATVHNNQRDGFMRQQINTGRVSYSPNSLGSGCPYQAGKMQGGFSSYTEKIDAHKIRARSKSFFDHFSQAKLFFNSQTEYEQQHIIDALCFELGKVETKEIRQRMVGILSMIDDTLASEVAGYLGLPVQSPERPVNKSIPADGNPSDFEPVIKESKLKESAALSMANTIKDSIKTRKIAVLVADGVNEDTLITMQDALTDAGATAEIIAPRLGTLKAEKDTIVPVKHSFLTAASVLFDAVYVPGGDKSVAALKRDPDVIHFINQAYKHCKPIAFDQSATDIIGETNIGKHADIDEGIIVEADIDILTKNFIHAIKQHRFWEREQMLKKPA